MKALIVFLIGMTGIQETAAEIIYLVNGSRLKGRIIEEDNALIVVEARGKQATIPRDRIARIEYGYDRRALEQLRPSRPRAYLEQGVAMLWSNDARVSAMGERLIHIAIKLDPRSFYVEGNMILARWAETRKDRNPAKYYRRILQARPGNKEARKRLDDWFARHPEIARTERDARKNLAGMIDAIIDGADYKTAIDLLSRARGAACLSLLPMGVAELTGRLKKGTHPKAGSPLFTEEDVRKLRILRMRLASMGDDPLVFPGPRLPQLGEWVFEPSIDYTRTLFRNGRFVRPE